MSDKPYRTLFVGTLVQDSSLSVGGSNELSGVDDPLCRDGEGRFTLRGTSLAGALVATARKLGEVPREISVYDAGKKPDEKLSTSLWQFYNAHPESKLVPEARQGVGIHQSTGASAEGVLFDAETLPRGTEWCFILEVDTHRAAQLGIEAEAIAAQALREWMQGRCWIGRAVARGMGWMTLQDVEVYQLTTADEHLELWPNSFDGLDVTLAALREKITPVTDWQNWKTSQTKAPWHYIELSGTIRVGEKEGGYGLDGLSVSGHAANLALNDWDDVEWYKRHYLHPLRKNDKALKKDFGPDSSIVMTFNPNTKEHEPFIPGSALRGPLRHALSRQLRKIGKPIHDPNDGIKDDITVDDVAALFGYVTKNKAQSASLLVRDAYLKGDWQAAWLQHHAEDEFSGGVYGSSKFDRVALIQAEFEWRMVIEAESPEQAEACFQNLRSVLALGEKRHLAIGGNQWRGLGWVQCIAVRLRK